jgi:hypothetical protein
MILIFWLLQVVAAVVVVTLVEVVLVDLERQQEQYHQLDLLR